MLELIAELLFAALDLFLPDPSRNKNDHSIVGESRIEVQMRWFWRVLAILAVVALVAVFYFRNH